jgi:hypothetical protein
MFAHQAHALLQWFHSHLILVPSAALVGLVALFGFVLLRGSTARLMASGVLVVCLLIIAFGVRAF